MNDFKKFQELIKDQDYVENGFYDDDFGQDFYECRFMPDVCARLEKEYNIISEPSTQGGGRMGADWFYLLSDEGQEIAECKINIEDEREWMFEEIESYDNYQDAVEAAADGLANYCEGWWEFYEED